jgi:radical SAM protein with 4Fe4S-binding SPASM domain
MDSGTVQRILLEAKGLGVKSVKFNWRGESTLHPYYIQILNYAKELGFFVYVNTSLSAVYNIEFLEGLAIIPDVLKVSIDSIYKETYEKIRKNGDFNRTLSCLVTLSAYREYYNKSKIIISRRRIKDDGLETDEKFKSFFIDSGFYVDFDIKDAIIRNREGVYKYNKLVRKYCGQPSRRLVIAVDGDVYACCVAYNEDNILCYGNIHYDTLEDIWKGEQRKNLVYRLKNNKHLGTCKNCTSNDGWRRK